MAFVSGTPLSQRRNFNGTTSIQQRTPVRTALRPSSVKSCTNSSIDFNEIAKRLAEELKDTTSRTPISEMDPKAAETSDGMDLDGHFDITFGNGDIPLVRLRHAQSGQIAEVYTYGACMTSWNVRGNEVLWMSDTNKWELGGKAIRGGIPLCFPQFGPYGNLVQHGFGRITSWSIKDTVLNEDDSVSAVFSLSSEEAQHEEITKWGFKFNAEYTVTLSNIGLEAKLAVTNTGDTLMPISFAFHNYFKVSSIDNARLFGFEELRHLNRLDGDREVPASDSVESGVSVTEETDRIYLDAPEELAMFDFASLRVLKIKKTPTLPNATMWNPFGSAGCDPGWKDFVCIEPAVINPAATIPPGETWVGAQLLGVE